MVDTMDVFALFAGVILAFSTVMAALLIYTMESVPGRVLIVFLLVLVVGVAMVPILYHYGFTLGEFVVIPTLLTNLSLSLTDYMVGLLAGAGIGAVTLNFLR